VATTMAAPGLAADTGSKKFSRSPMRLGILGATAVAAVVLSVLAHFHPVLPGDVEVTQAVQRVNAPWFQAVLDPFNRLGFPPMVDVVYGTVTLLVFLRGRKWAAASCAVAGLGAAGLNFVTKTLVARPRPPADLVHVQHMISNSSFPAGHVLNYSTFAGFLAYLAWVRLAPSWRRTALVTMLALTIALMGLARIASGEHWTSDVLGGYLFGSLWLAATIHFYRWCERRFVRR
jgi:membrane-associated phospholipid phosphatase